MSFADELPADIKEALDALELGEEEGKSDDDEDDKEDEKGEKGEQKRRVEHKVKTLLAMELPNNPAGKYLECLKDEAAKEKFKTDEYMPAVKSVFAGLEGVQE